MVSQRSTLAVIVFRWLNLRHMRSYYNTPTSCIQSLTNCYSPCFNALNPTSWDWMKLLTRQIKSVSFPFFYWWVIRYFIPCGNEMLDDTNTLNTLLNRFSTQYNESVSLEAGEVVRKLGLFLSIHWEPCHNISLVWIKIWAYLFLTLLSYQNGFGRRDASAASKAVV